jgi:hypothetical protein
MCTFVMRFSDVRSIWRCEVFSAYSLYELQITQRNVRLALNDPKVFCGLEIPEVKFLKCRAL